MRSRGLVFCSFGLLLAVLLHTGVWVVACLRLQDGFREALAASAKQGMESQAGAMHWAGWPFAAEVVVNDVRVRGSAQMFPPELDWAAERLRLRLSARHPTSLQLLPEGREVIAMAGLPNVPFGAEVIRIVVDLTGHNPVWGMARSLDLALPGGGHAQVATASLAFPSNSVVAALSGIALPGVAAPIGMVQGRITIEPPFPVAATAAASASAWRAASGRVSVEGAQLRWEGLDASLTGSGGLDDALQPEGSGELTVTGLTALLDRLTALGAVNASSAVAAKAVFALLAAPGAGRPVPLPVLLRGGVVSVARFPLLRLAPLAWE